MKKLLLVLGFLALASLAFAQPRSQAQEIRQRRKW
jgi:hypothetical protein